MPNNIANFIMFGPSIKVDLKKIENNNIAEID